MTVRFGSRWQSRRPPGLQHEAVRPLLVLLVALTFFYATLLWLPFRGTTLLMRRFRQSLSRKTRDRKISRLRSAGVLR